MTRTTNFMRRTFDSLSIRNYRLYFYGQAISQTGSWAQTVAQGLLVLMLTGSGTALGVVTALQTIPVLILGAWGGVMVDRYPKRQLLYVTQIAGCIVSLLLGILIVMDAITLWIVFLAAIANGLIKVVDNPARQTFVREMVGNDHLTNAVSLNSLTINLARVVGPALAGILVAAVGIGMCFILDGLSFLAVIYMLWKMREDELHPAKIITRAKGQMAAGWHYVRNEPIVRNVLIMMTIIGTFTYEFSVVLPLLAEFTFKNGASGYATLTSSMGVGAVIGGLYTASRRRGTAKMLVISAALFGGSVLLVAISPTFPIAVLNMVIVGFFSINFTSLGNVTIQLASRPDMQGRVMSFWSMAFLGTTPIGGPIMGAVGEHAGARVALLIGGLAALAAAGVGLYAARIQKKQEEVMQPDVVG
ncbi:MAG: MFS transporter [Thermomicrobiales bacterium]|nr:MFS transporter [Thermomicrobiales bacterium]MCO5219761.1 MFS transporter [Thermomicrobiales bacterium]MCO5225263.1 MFS transporter [Thermomicrobiales bacterium]